MVTRQRSAVVGRAQASRGVRAAVRSGFAASGLIHILIGFIAIRVAMGAGGAEADQSGALGQLAATPGGAFVLWAVFVGFAALGLWLLVDAFLLPRGKAERRTAHMVTSFAKAIVYLALAATAFSFARGGATSSATSTNDASKGLLSVPGGVIVLAIVGLGLFAVGGYLFVKGVRRRFVEDLVLPRGNAGRATIVLGVFGYLAKAVALGAVGTLFVVAAITHNATEANGLDGALKSLATLPFGSVVLVAVGIGLIAYGLYSFVRARFAKL